MTPPTPQSGEVRDVIHTYLVALENHDFSVEQILSNIMHLIQQSQAAAVNTVLDRVEKEVIGDDEDRRGKEDLPGYPVLVDLPGQIKNELRTEQRQRLQQLRQEQMGKEVK